MSEPHLLVATDLSSHTAAARWAADAARRLGARVTVAHVIELDMGGWLAERGAFAVEARTLELARQRVRDWYREATGDRPDDIDVRAGGFVRTMHAIARRVDPLMLVMSRTSKSRFSQFFLGSRVQHLASKPPCPLVVVHPEHDRLAGAGPLVVATDFSPAARTAIDFAGDIANRLDAPLDVVHVLRAPTLPALDAVDGPMLAELHGWARGALEDITRDQRDRHPGLAVEVHLLEDDPVDGVAEHAEACHARLLLVGQTGYTHKLADLLGSVTRGILHHLPGTICIVPPTPAPGGAS